MALLVIGLNHKTAPVDIREKITFGPDIIVAALRKLTELSNVRESVILSTCNRTEVYCHLSDNDETPIRRWITEFHNTDPAVTNPYLYSHLNRDAVEHVQCVAGGLDSLVLGEPQILGQVKSAFQVATDAGTTGKMLNRLFQHTFSVSKQIRTDTAIGSSPVSVAFAAVSLAKQIFADMHKQTALLIGAGETIELAARHLHQQGVGRMIIANRTVDKARKLAEQFDAYAISLPELSAHLAEADIVVSSTAAPVPILGKGAVESALKQRRHRPMFMVDIAVPRDIEAEVGELDDIYLYTVDDLEEVIEENQKSRLEAAEQAREIIASQSDEFMDWLKAQDAISIVQDYREQAEQTKQEVLEKAQRMHACGKDVDDILNFLANTLTNKLLHSPSTELRKAAFNGETEVISVANKLFQLSAK